MNRLSSASHFLRGAGSLIDICPARKSTQERLGQYYPYALRYSWTDRVSQGVGLPLRVAMEEARNRESQKKEIPAP